MTQPGPLPDDQGGLGYHSIAAIAAGSQIFLTIPTTERWKIWGLAYTLTTAAAAVNRSPGLAFFNGANSVQFVLTTTFQGPGLTWRWHFSNNWPLGSGGTGTDKVAPAPWPLLVPGGTRLEGLTTNFNVFDQYTLVEILREVWLEPN